MNTTIGNPFMDSLRDGSMLQRLATSCVAFLAALILPAGMYSQSNPYYQSGGTATLTNQTYTNSAANGSGVKVTNGGTFTLSNSTVRTTGATSSPDSSSFYGLDAGVLANAAAAITLTGSSISTTGTGANGVFSTGTGTSIVLVNDTIVCTGQLGHGVDATMGGVMTLTDVKITTGPGANSAAIATDRGGGTITVTRGTMTTSGADAPGIYSTGNITVSGAVITATASEGAVIEGENSITLTNTALSGGTKWGVMIYQSMSGDATGIRGTFTMTGGSLSAAAGPVFYNTNSTAIITLAGVSITANSGILLNAGAGNWGTSGRNGGTASLTCNGQVLSGNMTADSISSISTVLSNGSSLTGAVNSANKAKKAAMTLDASSAWIVTANSYVTTLVDSAGVSGSSITNIVGNGHSVHYDSSAAANSYLAGLTYSLVNGGQLTPETPATSVNAQSVLPATWKLDQNYPNPFNPATVITYQIPSSGQVTLKVYDLIGREVVTLVDGYKAAGKYTASFDGTGLASGVYLYQLKSGNFVSTKKMVLVR